MLHGGDLQADDLGFVVPAPNLEGGQVVRLAGFEGKNLLGGEWPALEGEALARGFREVGEVAGFGGGEVSLGVDVEADAVQNRDGEPAVEPRGADVFVLAIDAVLSDVFAEAVQEVADVVEQRSGDQFVRRSGLLG